MNAVEIEEAVSGLAAEPFDPEAFPFSFLEAFGNKATTISRLKSGSSKASDVVGGVLQRNNIHIAIAETGAVTGKLAELKASPKTAAAKAKFILATDGTMLEAEDLIGGETVACPYADFANHFGFFLPLAGITTVRQISNNPIDIQATGRLNRLYLELLKENEEWSRPERRHDLNQFMARLIFCLFAEDTGIFWGEQLFTRTIEQMSDGRAGNTHEVVGELFRAMDTRPADRKAAGIRSWADVFPYVNGGLFDGTKDVPRFSRIARSYLLHAGSLDWKLINPDIFGSMIQAVAEDEERGELGLHYTSMPNILKVLNPLFLDDLHQQLEQAGDNPRKLLNLRRRVASIRVFDPACGSGNFLVIAYIQMREIEAEIIKRRREENKKSSIKLSNFYGIEIKDFAAEIARLSLLIAEFQCDVRLIGQQEALIDVLPLKKTGQIVTDNALRLDWLKVCPPAVRMEKPTDLFDSVPEQPEIDFEAERVETYICGNPPYFGSKWQTENQKDDLAAVFAGRGSWKSLDYVAGWFMKAANYNAQAGGASAFVSTNSICQGQQVPILWPLVFATGAEIHFAHTSFKWANLATRKAVVTVVVIGLKRHAGKNRLLFETGVDGQTVVRTAEFINAYLIASSNVIVQAERRPLNGLPEMLFGNMPRDAGYLLLSDEEHRQLERQYPDARRYIRSFMGSEDFTTGKLRSCIWINEEEYEEASSIPPIRQRLAAVAESRFASSAESTRQFAKKPYRFVQIQGVAKQHSIIIPRHTSESRDYLPVGINTSEIIIADSALAIYDAPIWTLALIASRIHLVWIATVCGKIKTDYRYSNTIGWNTFPMPKLTDKNKSDLSRCAEEILLARESHYPSTISELYDPDEMPDDLRHAHERNNETIERIYVGRRFKNDTERLEKLFEMYKGMSSSPRTGATHD